MRTLRLPSPPHQYGAHRENQTHVTCLRNRCSITELDEQLTLIVGALTEESNPGLLITKQLFYHCYYRGWSSLTKSNRRCLYTKEVVCHLPKRAKLSSCCMKPWGINYESPQSNYNSHNRKNPCIVICVRFCMTLVLVICRF